ncbi:MAG TPA: dihydroorotate dehydrogenase electron transfer subunit [Flavobacteriales bacterium]|nr:dihydroorotate dehydrogenase electron transfer subunit [Flavobacteriales bacterium]
MPYTEIARITENIEIAENTFQTKMFSPNISAEVKPGQFINILPSNYWGKVMRRPMSVAGTENEIISIIYKAVGEGTIAMKNWKVGEEVNIIGPLGNKWSGFNKTPVLIGGGVGIAPTLFLHNYLNTIVKEHYLVMGARIKDEHFIEHSPTERVYLTTDDGSCGLSGNVLNAIDAIREKTDINKVKFFVCGPAPMMEAIRNLACKENIDCEIALETIMACGIGICQGCTMEYTNEKLNSHTYRNKFGLVCMDGPVFNAKEIKTCYL